MNLMVRPNLKNALRCQSCLYIHDSKLQIDSQSKSSLYEWLIWFIVAQIFVFSSGMAECFQFFER